MWAPWHSTPGGRIIDLSRAAAQHTGGERRGGPHGTARQVGVSSTCRVQQPTCSPDPVPCSAPEPSAGGSGGKRDLGSHKFGLGRQPTTGMGRRVKDPGAR